MPKKYVYTLKTHMHNSAERKTTNAIDSNNQHIECKMCRLFCIARRSEVDETQKLNQI